MRSGRAGRVNAVQLTIIVTCILALLLGIEYFVMARSNREQAYRTTRLLADQVENVLLTNEHKEQALVDSLKENYITKAKAVSYIIDHVPGMETDISEQIRVAKLMDIDEIHLFDETGTIYAGTVPIYYGYSFDSGEQMAYFKPMLENKALSMCQDVTPNTAEAKSMMYAICWNDAGTHMIQVGIEPLRLMEELRANEISEVINSMPAYDGVEMIVADRKSGEILGSTVSRHIGRQLDSLGLRATEQLESTGSATFPAMMEQRPGYCTMQAMEDYLIAVVQDRSTIDQNIPVTLLMVLLYLLLAVGVISFIVRRMTLQILDEQRNANTDSLTGLLNRRAYGNDLTAMAKDPRRAELTYMTLDLNGLKAANDTLGHEAGDELLIHAARFILECFGDYGSIYRTGGDEFVAMLFIDDAQLSRAQEEFALRQETWTRRNGRELSVSCGCVKAKDHPELSLAELAKQADEEMYKAKREYYQARGHDRRR